MADFLHVSRRIPFDAMDCNRMLSICATSPLTSLALVGLTSTFPSFAPLTFPVVATPTFTCPAKMALGAAEGILPVQVGPFRLAWRDHHPCTSLEGRSPFLVIVGALIHSLFSAGWSRGDRHHSAQFGYLGYYNRNLGITGVKNLHER